VPDLAQALIQRIVFRRAGAHVEPVAHVCRAPWVAKHLARSVPRTEGG
jgi:hypothetical protein